jgi:hypothetical protein
MELHSVTAIKDRCANQTYSNLDCLETSGGMSLMTDSRPYAQCCHKQTCLSFSTLARMLTATQIPTIARMSPFRQFSL